MTCPTGVVKLLTFYGPHIVLASVFLFLRVVPSVNLPKCPASTPTIHGQHLSYHPYRSLLAT